MQKARQKEQFRPRLNKMYSMVLCVVGEGWADGELPECDIAVFGFSGLGEVDFEKELRGETEKFEGAARLSRACGCGVVCACKTLSRGIRRRSAAVADGGKLLGITDMNHVFDGENVKGGANLGLFRAGGCKVGVVVDNDLVFPETFKALSLCGCNVVVALIEEIKDNLPPMLARAYAYLYGVPIVMCAGKRAYFADTTGAIASSSQKVALFEFDPQNSYRLVTTRRRGAAESRRTDY